MQHCDKKIKQNNETVDSMLLYIKNIRGSEAYWNSALNERLTMTRCLGTPYYFLTLTNCSPKANLKIPTCFQSPISITCQYAHEDN